MSDLADALALGEIERLPNGQIIHGRNQCQAEGHPCCFHSPSNHHMVEWPLHVRNDRSDVLTERTCPHGIGHPDPDSMAWIKRVDPKNTWSGIHSCDGCCHSI